MLKLSFFLVLHIRFYYFGLFDYTYISSKEISRLYRSSCVTVQCFIENKPQRPSAAIVCHTGLHLPIYPLSGSRKIPIDFLSQSQCTE